MEFMTYDETDDTIDLTEKAELEYTVDPELLEEE